MFPLKIRPAVERILNQRHTSFELMSEKESDQRISEVMKAEEDKKRFSIQRSSASLPVRRLRV
jgi:hypothetical protein